MFPSYFRLVRHFPKCIPKSAIFRWNGSGAVLFAGSKLPSFPTAWITLDDIFDYRIQKIASEELFLRV
jgi:hypothetical protein